MKNRKLLVAIILNILMCLFVLIFTIFSIIGFHFMGDINGSLTPDSTNLFNLFTVDSNVLLGVACVPIIVYEILHYIGKIEKIPLFLYVLKLIATSATTLTFLTVTLFFCPLMGANFWMLYTNNNLFFHLIIPVMAIICFIFFEYEKEIKFIHTLYGLIPAGIYSIYYTVNLLVHLNPDGTINEAYDFYYFARNGLIGSVFTFIGMLLLAYGISCLLYFFNHLMVKKCNQ